MRFKNFAKELMEEEGVKLLREKGKSQSSAAKSFVPRVKSKKLLKGGNTPSYQEITEIN